MALDLLHKQNNGKIKGASGATRLLKRVDVSGLEQWETCTPEIARIIESLEGNIEAKLQKILKHHIMKTGLRFIVTLQKISRKYMTALMLILFKN